jgi:hypothetical protein
MLGLGSALGIGPGLELKCLGLGLRLSALAWGMARA